MTERREVSSAFCSLPEKDAKFEADLERAKRIFFAMGGKVESVPFGVSGQIETKGQHHLRITTEKQKARKRAKQEAEND